MRAALIGPAPPVNTSWRWLAAALVALPLPVLAVFAAYAPQGPGRHPNRLVLAGLCALVVLGILLGPIAWPGVGRGWALVAIAATFGAVGQGVIVAWVLRLDRDACLQGWGAQHILTIAWAIFFVAGSVVAFWRQRRVVWAWPAAALAAALVGEGLELVLAAAGMAHHCYT